ncbi:hypothetical protein GCM10027592_21940 [Spirosoma flavus]
MSKSELYLKTANCVEKLWFVFDQDSFQIEQKDDKKRLITLACNQPLLAALTGENSNQLVAGLRRINI